MKKEFICSTIPGACASVWESQGRNLKLHIYSQKQIENKCMDSSLLACSHQLSLLVDCWRPPPREWNGTANNWLGLLTSVNSQDNPLLANQPDLDSSQNSLPR